MSTKRPTSTDSQAKCSILYLREYLPAVLLSLFLSLSAVSNDALAVAVTDGKYAQDFNALLKESGLSYQPVKGYTDVSVAPFYTLPHEKAVVSTDGKIEVRYAIRPLHRIEIDYEDPHNAAPHPNDMFEMLFRTLTESIAAHNQFISRAYTVEQSKKLFNAGWSSVAVFDIPKNSKATKFKQALLIAIHHNDKADAYILCLTNDLDSAKPSIKAIKKSLRFTRFEKGINMPNLDPSDQ